MLHLAPTMSTAEQVVQHIRDTKALFESQAAVGLGAEAQQTTMQGMARSIQASIASLRSLTVAGAATLNTEIAQSLFSVSLRASMAASVATRALAVQPHAASRVKKDTQEFDNPLSFFTEEEWTLLLHPKAGGGRSPNKT